MDAPSNSECPNHAPTLDSLGDHNSDAAIKFLNQILLDDNLDENDHMSYDPIALRATENSFYEALHQNPLSPNQEPLRFNNNSERLQCTFGSSGGCNTTFGTDQSFGDLEEPKSSLASDPSKLSFESSTLTSLDNFSTDFTIRKKHTLPDTSLLEEERSSKYSVVYEEEEEIELSEMFDKVLICADNVITDRFHLQLAAREHNRVKHSSPTGDASQRMAHAFANALEARLNGTGAQLSEALAPNKMAASGLLKSFLISWPISRISLLLANKMILEVASRVGDDNPRDAVLKLIRETTPHVFVPNVLSGSRSCPLFLSWFREAYLSYSNYFDMFDATLPRGCSRRLRFEQEFLGREIMNTIACEGMERLERPETYKQWHLRITKAGFKPMPMNQDLVKKLRGKVKAGYHKDFVFDEDGHWVLQGWKGRTLCGVSCWVPHHNTWNTWLMP
ncbi:unnamed protein product [Cuscuta campestris]|uniref:Uncharacterized protein n=1 Tax=Cuscuta campestris TaxID=132261 RepID=A0A484NBF9_9ASTE|nr:unnamed protein product [Cuscuta campestris]